MEKNEIMAWLNKCVSEEEVPLLTLIDEIDEMITESDFPESMRQQLLQQIKHLKTETVEHATTFTRMQKYILEK